MIFLFYIGDKILHFVHFPFSLYSISSSHFPDCIGAMFGLNCKEVCHCSDEACDKVTGRCNGQCLSNWMLPDCQTGILICLQFAHLSFNITILFSSIN